MADECCCLVCVRTQEVGVVEDLGQFKQLLQPGLHCICWPLQSVVGRMSLRIQQLDVICETKTKDNVCCRAIRFVDRFVDCGDFVPNFVMVENPSARVPQDKDLSRVDFFSSVVLSNIAMEPPPAFQHKIGFCPSWRCRPVSSLG
mmetsp:Transcript_15043/g.41846  ORF Transcript_15043/g.41846 Transcript_15043/m.41846 type:complete len:145 (+) Transcript_15043:23-457(+)